VIFLAELAAQTAYAFFQVRGNGLPPDVLAVTFSGKAGDLILCHSL
jgi:hypothetical protein